MERLGQTPLRANARAMAIGQPRRFGPSRRYVGAWLYLAIAGSVIGFTAYLTRAGRMGADLAAYCTVLSPVVALTVSAAVEGYRWATPALFGLVLVAASSVVMF